MCIAIGQEKEEYQRFDSEGNYISREIILSENERNGESAKPGIINVKGKFGKVK